MLQAQSFKLSNSDSSLSIFGTSSLHDWEEVAETYSGTISIDKNNESLIKSLEVTVQAESLKSGKGAMDKNTYKALKTDKYKNITFSLTEVKETTDKGNGNYAVKVNGNLTIAGTKKSISLPLDLKIDGNSLSIVGQKKMKMTDFNVDPPKALLGTITTGDEITVKFNLKSSN